MAKSQRDIIKRKQVHDEGIDIQGGDWTKRLFQMVCGEGARKKEYLTVGMNPELIQRQVRLWFDV